MTTSVWTLRFLTTLGVAVALLNVLDGEGWVHIGAIWCGGYWAGQLAAHHDLDRQRGGGARS